MTHHHRLTAILTIGAALAVLSGCQPQDGPMERAGKEVDKTANKAGQQVEKAGEKLQEAAKDDKR